MDARRVAPLALVIAVLASACASVVPGRATPAAEPPPPGLEAFYGQQLQWGPCPEFGLTDEERQYYADPAFDCTRVTVPLDYEEPAGETATIGVLRKRADGERIGSLLMNPGGPGAAGTNLAAALAGQLQGTPLGDRFDLIGFDPRGVGSSEPAIDCENDAERDEERADVPADGSTPEGVALLEAESQQFVDRCTERVGVDVLAHVGTREVVRDLDVMRAALGDRQLTFLGYSYGTFIGAEYAEAFPANVRALVLDGAVDPAQDYVESSVAQNAGFQLAFDAFSADCARRQLCPLGPDPTQSTVRFQELVRPLLEQPVPTRDGRTLGYGDAITGTIQALYSDRLWDRLRSGLLELVTGNGQGMIELADDYESREPNGVYDNSLEAFPVISCVDDQRITDPAVYLEIDRRSREVAPFGDDGRGPSAARPPCAFWPVPPTTEPALPSVEGLPPVLVISVTGDPATPYEAGVRLADQLGGALLSVEGNQHTVALTGVRCVDDAVTRYLVDLVPPEADIPCAVE